MAVFAIITTVDRVVNANTAMHQLIFYHSLQHGRRQRVVKRTEQNLIVRSGKCEAEVTNDRRLRSTYGIVLLKLTTDRHEASRGVSATAELLV